MAKEPGAQLRRKNGILNRWEQFYLTDCLASFPTHIQFPTGTRCNLRCSFCTERSGSGAANYHYKDLSYAEFSGIVGGGQWKKALMSVGTIALYGWGEPLFNKDYGRIADYLLDGFPGLGICISSNGVLFDEAWARKFVAAASADINFSVNAASAETFRSLTGSDQFPAVIRNIDRVTRLRREKGGAKPSVTLSFVATTENVHELSAFVELAARLQVDSVIVQDIMTLNEDTSRMSLANRPRLARSMFQKAREQARLSGVRIAFVSFETHSEQYFPTTAEMRQELEPREPVAVPAEESVPAEETVPSPYRQATDCFDPWERFMVRADGEVFPCCRSQSFPDFTLGNVFRRGFQEIWNGEAYRAMRSTVNTCRPPAVCAVCPRKAGLD